MAVITHPSKRKSMSILAEDLRELVTFDSKQTLPVSDIASDKYNEGMSLYLQSLGVNKLDTVYNEQVKHFELQLEEQELEAKLAANVAAESAANIAVEAQPGLGTGAAAVASANRQAALGSTYEQIETGISEAYTEGMTNLAESYQTELESILGEYDPATGTFKDLADYESMSDKATQAMVKAMARLIDANVNTSNDDYIDLLKTLGYIEAISADGVITLSALGQEQIDALINGIDPNKPRENLGGNSLFYTVAEEMARSDYILSSSEIGWESLSDEKRGALIRDYESWLYNNTNALRLTAWDLYEVTDEGFALDTTFSVDTSALDNLEHTGVDETTGERVVDLDMPDEWKQKFLTGEIADGTYLQIPDIDTPEGKGNLYYYADGVVYQTIYNKWDQLSVIAADTAVDYLFGSYHGSGKSAKKSNQTQYVNRIISAARAGRIPDGTYVCFNYGSAKNGGVGGYGVYQYTDGKFIRANDSDQIEYNGKVKALSIWLENDDFMTSSMIIRMDGTNNFSDAAKNCIGAKKSFLGWGDEFD